jgi:NAD(P)H-hydrate epimerase
MRAGAGYVHVVVIAGADPVLPVEVVSSDSGAAGPDLARFSAALIGPGLGRSAEACQLVTDTLSSFDGPVVVDGDGLTLIAEDLDALHDRSTPAVLTPHDGEYRTLTGEPPGEDRMDAALLLAQQTQSVVLLKGPATVVASPNGDVRVTNTGDQRLASAGTGDVLAGIIGALLAQNVDPFDAAAAGAFLHGTAASLGHRVGFVASDLLALIPKAFEQLETA